MYISASVQGRASECNVCGVHRKATQKLDLEAVVAAHRRYWELNSTTLQWQDALLTPRASFLHKGRVGFLLLGHFPSPNCIPFQNSGKHCKIKIISTTENHSNVKLWKSTCFNSVWLLFCWNFFNYVVSALTIVDFPLLSTEQNSKNKISFLWLFDKKKSQIIFSWF